MRFLSTQSIGLETLYLESFSLLQDTEFTMAHSGENEYYLVYYYLLFDYCCYLLFDCYHYLS